MMNEPERLSVREAAKKLGKGHAFVRRLIESGKVRAWRDGGNEQHPRLKVDLSELRHAIDRETLYVPDGMSRKQVRRLERKAPPKMRWHPALADL